MDWPIHGNSQGAHSVVNADTSTGSTVNAPAVGGSANTKGSWAEVSASWPTYGGLVVYAMASTPDYLIDIAIGGAGSEVVIVENLYAGNGTILRLLSPCVIPLAIKSGERVSARAQATSTGVTVDVFCLAANFPVLFGRCTTYGANTADSGGTNVDAGASANTKGAWSEVSASTTNDIKALILALGNKNNPARATAKFLIDIAVGAAGSEEVIVSNFAAASRTETDTMLPQTSQLINVSIPAGTRLSVRCQSDITDATDRTFDAIIYGFD